MQRISSFFEWWKQGACVNYDAVLFDIDGTLILGRGNPMPGAPEVIDYLHGHRFPFRLLTNDGNRPRERKCNFVTEAGIRVTLEEVISCSHALKGVMRELGLTGQDLFIMGDPVPPGGYIRDAGMNPVTDPAKISGCSAIFAAGGRYEWRECFLAVFNELARNPGKPFVVANPDSYYPVPEGGYGIGAGSQARYIIQLLSEIGIRKEPVYLGKPYRAIFDYAFEDIRNAYRLPQPLRPERVLMLGDFLKSDIAGANAMGMTGGLMMTGVTTEATLESAPPEERPDYIFDHLA